MATFVLVHGAPVGGWSWKLVTPLLRAQGHEVYAPTLTGLGHRAHLASPEVDLETHIQDVVNLLEYEDLHDVILVGWSYGGTLITGVADRMRERISQLVYLDADVPRDGETSSTSPERMAERERYARESGDGWRAFGLPPEMIGNHLREFLSEDMVEWVVSRLVAQPLSTWTQPVHLTNPKLTEIQHTFIRCTVGLDENDPDVLRTNYRMETEPEWQYREVAAEHFAPLTAPNLVAEALLNIADRKQNDR
jgi:pimeloyl-ACP methyl ester carboxylesterase